MISALTAAANVTTTSDILQFILGGVLIFLSLVMVLVVLFQSAKDKRLSGTIAGGAETFFGKTKGSSIDKILSKVTVVVAILVVLVTIALNIIITVMG